MAPKILLSVFTAIVMCKLSFCAIDTYANTSITNLDSTTNFNKLKRAANDTDSFEIDEYVHNTTLNRDKLENNDTEFGKYFYENYTTTEGCVGDKEYCNMSLEEYMDMLNEYIFPQPYEWVLIATHGIVFVIGLIGNALVCTAVYRNHSMRTVTNYFIVNLAVADFMVILICLPPTVLWDVTETWFFGTAMCRIVLYFQVS